MKKKKKEGRLVFFLNTLTKKKGKRIRIRIRISRIKTKNEFSISENRHYSSH